MVTLDCAYNLIPKSFIIIGTGKYFVYDTTVEIKQIVTNFCQFRNNKFTLESDRSYTNSAAGIVLRIFKFHTLFFIYY